jgi:circadian clock protein KaiC
MPESVDYVGSGIAGLDQVLGGGFPCGQFTLIRGTSGVGKTTLGLQFLMEGARRGEAALYLGTSETEQEIRRIARSHGWSLNGVSLHHHEHPPVDVEQTMLHPAEVELPQTMESLLSVVSSISPARLVIDSLAEFRLLARDELWYRRQLLTLRQRFADDRCTVLVVDVPNGGRAVVDSIVNGVIELEQNAPLYGPDERRLRVVKIRGQQFATGHHDYRIRKGGLEVFPRLTAAEHRHRFPYEQLSTGIPQMDAMFQGGLVRGTSTFLLGPSGTGKSLIATQLAIAAAERGERSALFIFDERVQTLFQRAAGVGLALQHHVDQGTIQIQQIDPAELSSGEFSHIVKALVERDGMRMLVVDSLNGYAYAMPEEKSLSLHLHELISYLNQTAVTPVFTMTQHGMVADQLGQPFDISYVADAVVLFRHFEFGGRIHKAVSVYKCRSGPHETAIHELQITANGVQVSEPLRQFQGILTGVPKFIGETLHGDEGDDETTGA